MAGLKIVIELLLISQLAANSVAKWTLKKDSAASVKFNLLNTVVAAVTTNGVQNITGR